MGYGLVLVALAIYFGLTDIANSIENLIEYVDEVAEESEDD